MKIIKYNICNAGDVLTPIEIQCTAAALEANLAIAEKEAYNGEYTIEDDGRPETDTATTDDVLNALLGVTE